MYYQLSLNPLAERGTHFERTAKNFWLVTTPQYFNLSLPTLFFISISMGNLSHAFILHGQSGNWQIAGTCTCHNKSKWANSKCQKLLTVVHVVGSYLSRVCFMNRAAMQKKSNNMMYIEAVKLYTERLFCSLLYS